MSVFKDIGKVLSGEHVREAFGYGVEPNAQQKRDARYSKELEQYKKVYAKLKKTGDHDGLIPPEKFMRISTMGLGGGGIGGTPLIPFVSGGGGVEEKKEEELKEELDKAVEAQNLRGRATLLSKVIRQYPIFSKLFPFSSKNKFEKFWSYPKGDKRRFQKIVLAILNKNGISVPAGSKVDSKAIRALTKALENSPNYNKLRIELHNASANELSERHLNAEDWIEEGRNLEQGRFSIEGDRNSLINKITELTGRSKSRYADWTREELEQRLTSLLEYEGFGGGGLGEGIQGEVGEPLDFETKHDDDGIGLGFDDGIGLGFEEKKSDDSDISLDPSQVPEGLESTGTIIKGADLPIGNLLRGKIGRIFGPKEGRNVEQMLRYSFSNMVPTFDTYFPGELQQIWESYLDAVGRAFTEEEEVLTKALDPADEDLAWLREQQRIRGTVSSAERTMASIINMRNRVRDILPDIIPQRIRDASLRSFENYFRLRYNVGDPVENRGILASMGDEALIRLGLEEVDDDEQVRRGNEEANRLFGGGDLEDIDLSDPREIRRVGQSILARGGRYVINRLRGDPEDPEDPEIFTLTWRGRRFRMRYTAFIALLAIVVGLSKKEIKKQIDAWRKQFKPKTKPEDKAPDSGTTPLPPQPPAPPQPPQPPTPPGGMPLLPDDAPYDVPTSDEIKHKFGEPYATISESGEPLGVIKRYKTRLNELSDALITYRKYPNIANLIENEINLRTSQLDTYRNDNGLFKHNLEITTGKYNDRTMGVPSGLGKQPSNVISSTHASLLPMTAEWVAKYRRVGVLDEVKNYNKIAKSHNENMSLRQDMKQSRQDVLDMNSLYSKIKKNFDFPPEIKILDPDKMAGINTKHQQKVDSLEKEKIQTLAQMSQTQSATERNRLSLHLQELQASLQVARENLAISTAQEKNESYLDDTTIEDFVDDPTDIQSGRKFARVQQLESFFANNYPDIFDTYNKGLEEIVGRAPYKDEKDYYDRRIALIKSLGDQHGVPVPDAPSYDDDFSKVEFSTEDKTKINDADKFRPSQKIGGSALELSTTKQERVKENTDWSILNNITPEQKLGNSHNNTLVEHNDEIYRDRFTVPTVPKRNFITIPKPVVPERKMPFFPNIPPVRRANQDAYSNQYFTDVTTPLQLTSVNRDDWINVYNDYIPEGCLSRFTPRPTNKGLGPRRDQLRFTPPSNVYGYVGSSDLYGVAGVPSDRWVFENSLNFGVNRPLTSIDFQLCRK